MRKGTAIVVGASCFVLGLAIGALGNLVRLGPQLGGLADGVFDSVAQQLESEAYAKYRLGTYSVAKKTLLQHAQFAGALAQKAEGIRRWKLASDAGLSYARIAVAAERANLPAEAAAFFVSAQGEYARRGERRSAEELRQLVLTLDLTWDREVKGESQ